MSTTTEAAHETESTPGNWRAGVVAGIAGGIAMGVLVVAMNEPTIAVAIPSLYGLAPPAAPAAGLAVHISHGAVLGVVFAGIAGMSGIEDAPKLIGAGAAWGVATWAVLAALVMPLWLGAVGSPASPPFPNFAPPSLLWHVAYGLVLGGVYAATDDSV
ncbi:histidine kinase [Halobaculum sp. CBA1158]|uniref:histidine kinase n=1 Tax=Halobaculum sp. CBA1158 TaxID=2904243 RepID=UPI001F47DDE2|nr:histidine kinase [Halobaculum sp. CBA1158]UIP00951.1 histidine kinase [Halobaculum sp. CBA1158]